MADYKLHSEFLCRTWSCTEEEREELTEALKKDSRKDRVSVYFYTSVSLCCFYPMNTLEQLVLPNPEERHLPAIYGSGNDHMGLVRPRYSLGKVRLFSCLYAIYFL